ncbi:MAG: FHA domain-containing protein [Polyangia bacterium]
MAIRLTIIDPARPDTEHTRGFVQDRVVIGRARFCDICLPEMAVSTRHAEIRLEGTDYAIADLGSLNGTRVGGVELVPHRPRMLKNGDSIGIAGFEIRFRLGVAPGPAEPRDASVRQARQMLAAMLARSGEPRPGLALLVLDGPGKASRHSLPEGPAQLVIGRAREADIRLDDRDVSREHAVLQVDERGELSLRDLGSRHGISIGGELVESAPLRPGVSFVLGGTTLAVEHPLEAPLASVMEAPEEETSSYSPLVETERPEERDPFGDEPADAAESDDSEDETPDPEAREEELPVGPPDPMAYPGQAGYVRTEREIRRPELEDGSDFGLIVVGAIIVVAAVVGLVLLLA